MHDTLMTDLAQQVAKANRGGPGTIKYLPHYIISIGNSVSDGATNKSVLNIERPLFR